MTLNLNFLEYLRFTLKCVNLSLCYLGFSVEKNLYECKRASQAALLCSVYDIITDWKDYDPGLFSTYKTILRKYVNEELYDLVVSLYEKERTNKVNENGLERGVKAFEFITYMMGTRDYYNNLFNIYDIGIQLQIADDILDCKSDSRRGEQNCLKSDKKYEYLNDYYNKFSPHDIEKYFPNGTFLRFVLRLARSKAKKILSKESSFELLPSNSELVKQN